MKSSNRVFCFGEILWDALPAGIFLGGAPLNVAYHLSQLGSIGLPVSRIGNDFLGTEALRRMRIAGVSAAFVQIDHEQETGAVVVELGDSGDATYEIRQPAAWDFIAADARLLAAADHADAVVYGTLATRSEANCAVLDALLERCPVRFCDVNLRAPHDAITNALEWAARATILKLNAEELGRMTPPGAADMEQRMRWLADQCGVATLIVTCGGDGAQVLHEGLLHASPAPAVQVVDTVGAGDAFSAALLHSRLRGQTLPEALQAALQLGAYVAGCAGAQPVHPNGPTSSSSSSALENGCSRRVKE